MSAEVGGSDVTSIQDEELLRRMWQQTEDFGRKKEIRARMYKLREQRLKEFYTTGEVLHDVLSSTSSLDDSSAVRQVKSGGSNTRYHSSSDISSSQIKDQVVSKNSSYTTSSSIRHADSLNDDSFLTLKSKEIRDSESPTREFHKKQEKNVSDDGGYWRVVQESSSGAYEESGTIRDGVETTIHSKYKTEQSRTAGDSKDGLSTTTQVASSQETANIPSDGNSQNESSLSTCVVLKGGDIGGDLISSNSTSQSGKWSSTSSSSFVTQSQQKEQMTSSSSSSRAISSAIQTGQDISSHYILDSSNFGKDDSSLIKELSTSVSEIGQNISDVSSKRVTQRSQTSDLIIDENLIVSDCERVSTTGQNTNVSTSFDRSPLIDTTTIIDLNISMNDTLTTGTSVSEEKSSKVVEQRIMSELQKLDSFLLTQNATDSTPVSPHDARDSASWTIVSSTSKHRNGQDVSDQVIIDEFVFRSGNADTIKDTTNLQSKEFINQEKNSSLIVTNEKVLNDKETKIYVDGTPQIVHNTGKIPVEELKGTSNRTSNQETTTEKPSEGQYITTYKQDYTNKRISVDVSPTHEAFARSLRTSPEHGTPNSTRSSSKVSLDRSSPEKSPSKSPYRNRTSADNSLSSPNRSSPEKSAVRPSSARSSPEKINKTYPARTSPEKTGPTNISSQKSQSISSPDKISSPRLSPDKFTASNFERTVPDRISPEKSINKIPATRVSPESTTTSARWSPDRKSPQKDTINKTNRSSPARCSPEKMMPDSEKNTQTGKLQRQPDRRVSSVDRPREPSTVYSPTRKLSDSTRITITNKDNNVQTASVKERRKFSSGATRTSTKKRSSTPGVSPSLSPSREDDVNLRVRQSRPRSRGSSKSTTETEDSDYETKEFENVNEVKLDKQLKKQPSLINTKPSIEYVNSTKISEEVEITTFDDENYELEINRKIPYHEVSEASVRSAQSSPERKIPAKPNESPKSVLDKLTRDKSPGYSSEGSLIHELSYKQNDEKSAFTQVKQKNDLHRESLGSSPERNSFTPIKVFKTTPETSSQENEPADKTKTSPSTAKSPVQQSSVTFPSKTAESLKTVCPIPKKGQDMPTDKEPIKPDKPLSSRPEYFQEKDTSTQQYYKDTKQITTLDNDDSLSSCDYLKQNEKPRQLLQETSKPNIYNIVDENPDNIETSPNVYIPAKDSRKPEMQNTKNFIENEIQESLKVSGKYDKTIKKSRRSTNSDSKSSSISPCSSSPERPKITTGTSRVEITLRQTPKGHLSKNSLPQNERPGKEIPVTGRESPQKRFTTTKQVASSIRNKPKRPAIDSDETPDSSPERTPRGKIITKTPSKIRLLKPDKNNDAASRLPSKPSVTSVKTSTSPRSEQNTSSPIKKDKPFEHKLSDKSISSLSRVSDRPQNQRTNKVITRIPSSTDSSLRQGRTPDKSSEVFRSKKDSQQITKLPTNVQYSVDIIPHKNYSVRKPESSPEGRSPSLSPERVIPNSSSRYPSNKRSPITSPERQITPNTTKNVDDNRSNIPKRTSQFPSPDRHTRIPIQGKHTKSPTSSRYPADIIRKPSDHISKISVQNKPKDTLDQPSPRTSHKLDNSRAHYSSPSSSPDRTQQRITGFTATVKVKPVVQNVDTAKESRLHKTRKSPDDIDDRSTDRSSTLSSPETVKTAEDIVEELNENISEKRKRTEIYLDNLPEKGDLSPSNKEKGVPTSFTNKNNDYFESSTVINNRAHTLRQDTYDVNQHNEYITDDYDVDDVQDETPPEEFIVDDDSPVHPAQKLSSIPMRKQNLNPNQPYIEKSPLTKQIKSKPKPEKNTTVPRTKIIITTKSIPIKDVRNLNSRPISTKPTREVSTVLHQRSEPRVPLRRDQSTANQSPRNVLTKDTKISRVNSDKNVIKHHIKSPSNIQPKKHPSKSDVTVPSERNKISSVTTYTSYTRQQQPTTKNVTSAKSSGIKNTKSTITIQRPGQKPMVSKEEPNRRPISIAIASTNRTTVTKEKKSDKKHLKTKKIVPTKEHNTSPFYSEDEQEMPDIGDSEDRERFSEQEDDETDQEYIKELEDLRQTEEQSYASKVTHIKNREDRLLSTTYNGKKTSDSLTTIQIQLPKSSRESSPEYSRRPLLTTDDEDSTGPRYADKVSEPDDDDDSPKKKPPAVFRKPILHPVPLSEEYTDEEEPDLRPIQKEQPVKLNKGEHFGEFPHSQTPIEIRHPEKIVDRPVQYVGTPKEDDNIFLQLEKVTDLDEESDTDEALKSVSVANRVSLFLEEAKKTTAPHKSPQLVEENKKPMDSPTSVRKAKLMFENIAQTQKSPVKSPQSPRRNIPDIIDRPSVFEARRGGKVTSPVKDENCIHQEREFTEKQDESNYYDHSRRTSHYRNDEKHTGEDIPIKPLVTKHKSSPTALSDYEDEFDDTESFTQDEIKQSRRPSSTQEHPSDSKSCKPQPTSKLSNRSISPALKKMEYQHFPKDTAPIARKPSGTTRRPSYTSPEVSNEQTISRDDLPSTKISSDTYTRRKPSFPAKVVSPNPHDVAPGQKMSSNKHYNEKTLSSEHPVHRRPSTPSHKDYSHENKIPKEAKPSSPERTTNFKPRAESPPRKISTDTIIRKISTPKEVPTEPFNKRQPTSSNKPREISPVNKISTATLTRRKPTSPDRSIEEPSKICTDTYSRGKPKYPEQTVDKNYGTYTKVRPSTKQESAGRFDTFTMKGKSIGKKDVPEDENKTISKDYISRKEISPVNFNSEPKKGYLQDTFSSRKHAHEDLSSDEDSSKRNDFILRKTVDDSFEILPGEFPEDSHFYADTDKEPTIGYLQDTFSSRKHAIDDSQSDDETTHGRDSLPTKMPENICSSKIVDDFPEDRHFYPIKTRRDVSPADKDTSSIRRYSKEQPTDIATKQYSPTWKGTSPTRETSSKKEQSPARDYPRRDYSPSSKKSPSPSPTRRDFTHRASSPTKKDSITRRESAHRPENASSLRKDSLPKEKPKSLASKYLAKVEQKFPLKTVDIRPGGKFGVSLRQTNATTSTLQRRQSGDVTKTKSCSPNGEEVIVEDIFDLELLEMMLEKAVLYDERSAIRAQIRIVRRTMSESTTTTTTTTKTTKSTSSVEVTQRLSGREAPRPTGDRDLPRRRGSHERPDEAEPGRRPSSGYEPNTSGKPQGRRGSHEHPEDAMLSRRPSSGYEPNTSDKTRTWRRSPDRPGDTEPGRRPSSGYEPNTSDKPRARRRSPERPGDAEPGRIPSSGYEPNTSDKTRAWRRSPERPGDAEPGRRPSSGYEPNTSDKTRAWRRSPERPGDAEPGRRPSSGYEPNTSGKPQGRRGSHEHPEDAMLGRRPSSGYEPITSDKTRTWRRSPERPGDVEPGRRPSSGHEPNTSDKPRARKSSPITQRFFPEEGRRRPSQDKAELPRQSSPQRASPSRNVQEPGEKTPITKKTSHMSVEPKTAASPVKSPIKKSSVGESPREAYPTDSVTSSYGVGPTDENGRPLFGLRALRRTNTGPNNQIPQDCADLSPSSLEPEPPREKLKPRPTELKDASGRPLFGGLRALKRQPVENTEEPQGEEDMPEQPVSPQLKDLVSKHEQRACGNTVSQPSPDRQKPRAKLRDSFLLKQDAISNAESPRKSTSDDSKKLLSHRTTSLKAIIQKHESIAKAEESETDKQQHISENLLHSERTSEVSPVDLTRRTGILKKSLDDDDTNYQVATESSSRSTATVVSSRGTMRPDGTISLTRDVLKGESVQHNDEKPVNTISRTRYTYNTPEGKAIEAAPYDDEDSRTSSPERRGPRTQAANSTRRSQTTQDTTTTSVGRDNKSRTATRTTSSAEEEHKFSSSTSSTSRTSRVTPDKTTTKLSPAKVSTEKSFIDSSEDEHTTSRGGSRYESSTVTSLRSTEGIGSPLSVRRRIFANDEEMQDENISKSGSSYKVATSSSTSSSVRTSRETSGKKVSSSSFLEEERKSSTGKHHYDDDYESDSYQKSGRVVSTNTVPESSRLSPERSTSGDTRKVYTAETRYSTSSTTERRSSGTATTEHVSRSSPPSDSTRRRSSNLLENREGSPTPSNSSTSASKLARGGSVRALSQKFLQQAAEGSSESSRPQRNYPKAGLIFRSTSFRQSNGDTNDETYVSTPNIDTASSTLKQSMEGGVGFTSPSTTTTPRAESEGKSFLSNQTRVTGVQDVLTRMRNADQDVETGDSLEDREARALLNKFLGAQVLLSGVESVVKPATHTQSAALVRQVERQRILKTSTSSTVSNGHEADLEDIWDEKLLRQLLEKCSDYEGRRQIRARLRIVMAEQKACAEVVAAALADEDSPSHSEKDDHADSESNVERGESLLLPFLVEHLRSSLHQQQHSEDKDSHSNMVDSGTESGEDLKFLAAGLRDSLELEKGEGLEPLGPSLLAEVGSALARLQASLQLGGEIALEPERREALLQLVSRLQASLRLPAPPWGDKTPTPALHTTVGGGNRRANRQNRHTVGVSREELADARRLLERKKLIKETYAPSEHEKDKPSSDGNNTVPQSQETLAYPVIKQYSAEDVSSSDLSVTAPVWKAFRPVRFVPRKSRSGASVSNNSTARPFIAYSHQQHGWATSQEQRRSSCSNIEQNSYSKLPSQIDMKTNSIGNDTITESNKDNLDGKERLIQNTENNNLNVLEIENLDKPVALIHKEYRPGRKGEETVKPINKSLSQTSSLDSSSPQRSDSGNSVSDHVNSKPILSHHSLLDSSYSKSSTPQRSDSGASVLDKHINKQLAFYSSADNASAPLKSESGTSINDRAQQKQLSHSSSASSSTSRTSSHSSGMTSMKAHVPQQPNSHSSHSKSSLSSSIDSGKNSKESTPQEMIKQTLNTAEIIPDLHRTASKNSREPSAFVPYLRSLAQNTHVPLCQSISLDETAISSLVPHNKLRGSLQHKPISHTHSLDSSKSDYDPSVILFTPEQSVQIAIHKAAINKQISIEEEKRQNLSQLYNSEDEDSDIEEEGEVSSDESRISDSEEEVEETDSTVIQAKDISKNTGDSYKSQAPQNTSQQVDAKNRIEIKPKNESQRVNYCNTKTENTYAKPFVPLVNSKSQAIKNSQNIEKNINGTNPNHSVNNSQDINVTKDVVPRHTNKDQDMVLGKLGVEQNKTIYSGDKNENYMPTSGADTQQTTSAQSKITQRPNSQNYRVPDTHGSHSNKTFQQQPFQSYKNVEHIVEGGTNNTTKQNQMHTVEARAQMFQQKAFSTPQYAYQKQNENSRPKEDSSVSSAQRLLQMATEDNKSSYRTQGRGERKVKMKRANTIDIPKPLNFYSVEGDTDYSSDEDYEGTGEPKNVNGSNNNQHRAAYLALRGPIRVGGVGTATDDGKVIPPVLKPRTESDRKFLAFLEQHSTGKSKSSLWNPDAIKSSGYSPVSRGGMHWNNRFSNIKTAFESPGETGKSQPVQGKPVVAGPASARKFWQSADDSVAVVKNNPASANDPKLSRQGSIFLRKLFEQKDQEKHEQQAKLPWTEKASEVPEDAVVVGSLTVAASHKGIRGTVLSKKQLFTSPHSPSAQHLVNTFSHAPLSAFKPIEKKVRNVVETNNQPWATPSVSGTVKQLAAQKFCTDTTQQSNSIPNTGLKTPSKQKLGFTPYSHSKQDIITSPISPTLPWTKDGFHAANDNGVLKPTLAKFENLSRETSPTPIPPPLPRSRSQERIAIPSTLSLFSPKHNSAPAPPPRAFVPPPNPLNLTPEQSFAISQGSYISSSLCVSKLSPPRIPSPPTLAAPNLVHNYDQTQENYCISDDYGENQEVYDTLSGYPQQEYIHEHNTSIPPKQTYSGSVTSRSAIYPSAIRNSKKVNQHPQKELPQDKLATPVRPKMSLPLQLSKTLDSPDGSLPSPEAFTAFSRVMTGPISQQAVVVTQTTHRRGDEELEGKSSAARNLTSVLTRFSSPSIESADISNEKSPVPMISVYKGNDDSTESDLYKSNSPHKNGASSNISSPSNYQDESFKKQMSRSRSPRYEKYKEGITRHNSDPNIRGMISDEQFSTNQQQLQQEANILGSRNGLSPRQNEGSNKPPAHSYDSNSITSQSLEPSRYQLSNYVRPISTESLITATSREELQESGESVLTTRLQIPVYNNVRSNSLQDISPTKSDNSDCGYSVSPATTASVSPSLVLRKSESWHQLAAEQTKRRPLSLALPDLPTAGSISGNRRSHPALPKTKSSHSLAFPKQFEAAMTPESVKKNQKKVEAYFNMSSSAKIGASSQTLSVQGQSGKLHLSTSFDKKSPINKATKQIPPSPDILDLDINLENVDEAFESLFKAAVSDGVKHKQPKRPQVLNLSYDERPEVSSHRLQPNELRRSGSSPQFAMKQQAWEESSGVRTTLARNLAPYDSARHSESTARSSVKDGDTVTHTEVTTKKSSFSTSAVGKTRVSKDVIDLVSGYFSPLGQVISPFAKFQQLDKQTSKSAPSSPKTPGTAGAPLFKFTDPKLSRSASGVKDKLLYWSQSKTKEYKNIQIENFSTSWSNGLAFCALIHHFCPDAFDYETLKPEERRKNFELAFRVADDKAGIAPLLDVEDMVMMRKPDWKCVFTYVQSIYRRFKDED